MAQECKQADIDPSAQPDQFAGLLRQVVEHKFADYLAADGHLERSLSSVETLVWVLVKGECRVPHKTTKFARLDKAYYDCLFKYSQANLDRLLRHPTFHTVFSHFLNEGDFEAYAKDEETIQRSSQKYAKVLESLRHKLAASLDE